MDESLASKARPAATRAGNLSALLAGISVAVGLSGTWMPGSADIAAMGLVVALVLAIVGLCLEPGARAALLGFRIAASGLLVGIALSSSSGRHHHDTRRVEKRACYANQRTIGAAVELYNLATSTRRLELDEQFVRDLVNGGYLSSLPDDPGQGADSSGNYQFSTEVGGVTCVVHGFGQGSQKFASQ